MSDPTFENRFGATVQVARDLAYKISDDEAMVDQAVPGMIYAPLAIILPDDGGGPGGGPGGGGSGSAPVAKDDNYIVNQNTPLTIAAASGVLSNDTDADNDALTARLYIETTPTKHGTLTFNTNGSFTYTPDAGYTGADSFAYLAKDGIQDSNVGVVYLTVNAVTGAPVAKGDSYTTDEDTKLTVAAKGVLGNDTDAQADPLTAVAVTDPTNGKLSFGADGSFIYTPNANYSGSDSFTYSSQ